MAGTSRYGNARTATYVGPDGVTVVYQSPRTLPFGWTVAGPGTTVVGVGEVHRLDLVAFRTLGNALLAWQIDDANDAMDPFGLCDVAGRLLQVPTSGL